MVTLYAFREAGLIEKLFQEEMDKYNSAVATGGDQAPTALTMENLQGGSLLLVLMTIFNILIFLIEVCTGYPTQICLLERLPWWFSHPAWVRDDSHSGIDIRVLCRST